jgi:phenylpropionate dioxygenase-like ring-hydroxylating dioxygenase large terminal subunit
VLIALEDRCPHRAAPLSQGSVDGETLRCGYHNYGFNARGDCVDIPEAHNAEISMQDRCGVQRFWTRDIMGLIWISIADIPFPIEVKDFGHDHIVGSFTVKGDIRVWMDHFLDPSHCLWAHSRTVFGTENPGPNLDKVAVHIKEDDRYPVEEGVEIWYSHNATPSPRTLLKWAPLTAAIVAMSRKKKRKSRTSNGRSTVFNKTTSTHYVRADLPTPLCQRTRTRIGKLEYLVWTSLQPGPDNTHQFFYSSHVVTQGMKGFAKRHAHYLLHRLTRHHLGTEDNAILSKTPYIPTKELLTTKHDSTVIAMRSIFALYMSENAHLYPKNSSIHSLDYGPDDIEYKDNQVTRLRYIAYG